MVDTVQVTIGGDSAALVAATAKAEAALKQLQDQVRGTVAGLSPMDAATKSLIASWDQADVTLQKSSAAFAAVNEALELNQISAQQATRMLSSIEGAATSAAKGANDASFATAGMTREFVVLAHEAATGNFARIPGSLMVLTERMGGLTGGTLGWAAAIGVAAVATYELVDRWGQVEQAVRKAQGEMTITGQNSGSGAGDSVRAGIDRLKDTWDASNSEAAKAEATLRTLGGSAADYTDRIRDAAAAQATLTGGDLDKTVGAMVQAFNGGAQGALRWAESNHVLSVEQQKSIDDMVKGQNETGAYNAILEAMEGRFVASGAAIAKATGLLHDWKSLLAIGEAGDAGLTPDQVGLKLPSKEDLTPKPGTQANDSGQELAAVNAVNQALDQRAVIGEKLNLVRQAERDGIAGATEAEATLYRQLEQVHTASEQAAHEKVMSDLQAQLAAARDSVAQRIQVLQQISAETVRYAGADSEAARQAATAVVAAQREAADQSVQLELSVLTGKQAAARQDLALQISIEDEKLAVLRAAGKDGTTEYQEALNQRAELVRKQADQGFDVAVEKLRQQQAAHKDDYAVQLQIEDQILQMYLDHYGANTKAYQDELKHREDLLRDSAAQEQQIKEITNRGVADRAKLQERPDSQEPKSYGIGSLINGQPDQDLAAAQAKLAADNAAQQQAMQASLASASSPVDQAKIYQDMLTAQAQYVVKSQDLNQQASANVQKSWQSVLAPIDNAFSQSINGMLRGTETLKQGIARAGQSIVLSFVDAAEKSLMKWVASELAKLTITETTQAGMTEATAANQAAQTAIKQEGKAAEAAMDSTSILNNAYTAATGAFSAVAGIPIVGPFLAPVAAAAAFAGVMAFDVISAAGGMGAVPFDDMPALLHKNEMVLPASIASPLRSAIGNWGMAPAAPAANANLSTAAASSSSSSAGGGVTWQGNVVVNGGAPADIQDAVLSTLDTAARHGVPSKYSNLQRVLKR